MRESFWCPPHLNVVSADRNFPTSSSAARCHRLLSHIFASSCCPCCYCCAVTKFRFDVRPVCNATLSMKLYLGANSDSLIPMRVKCTYDPIRHSLSRFELTFFLFFLFFFFVKLREKAELYRMPEATFRFMTRIFFFFFRIAESQ